MGDNGAVSAAVFLSTQMSIDRFLDACERNQELSALQRNDAAWRCRYNNLANDYNAFLISANQNSQNDHAQLVAMEGSIAALRETIRLLKNSEERVSLELKSARYEIRALLKIISERLPDLDLGQD